MSAPYQTSLLTPAQWRLLLIGVGVLAFGWLVASLSSALTPFLAAALLAYACDPLVDRLEARGIKRAFGSGLIILACGLIFIGLVLSVVPLMIELSGRIATRLPRLLALVQSEGAPWLKEKFGITVALDLPHLSAFAQAHAKEVQALIAGLLGSLSSGSKLILSLLVTAVLVPVVLYYLLVDWDHLLAKLDALIPPRWQVEAHQLLSEIDRVLGEFLRGQLSVMLILAAYYAIALAIAGVEFALPLGLLTGLLIFIPYVGFTLGLVLALLSAALQDAGMAPIIAVAAIYGGGQILEGFVLTPWLVGDRIGLHPVAVIFALLAFGQLFGFVGLLIALPAAACLLVALRKLRQRYLASDLYQSS